MKVLSWLIIRGTKSKYLRKVLIVLDNVNDPIILKCLVGNWDN